MHFANINILTSSVKCLILIDAVLIEYIHYNQPKFAKQIDFINWLCWLAFIKWHLCYQILTICKKTTDSSARSLVGLRKEMRKKMMLLYLVTGLWKKWLSCQQTKSVTIIRISGYQIRLLMTALDISFYNFVNKLCLSRALVFSRY